MNAGFTFSGAGRCGSVLLLGSMLVAGGSSRAHAAQLSPADTNGTPVAYLGVSTTTVSDPIASQLGLTPGMGLLVLYVDAESPAAQHLQQHDILLKLQDQLLVNHEQLAALVQSHAPGEPTSVTYLRAGETHVADVFLGTNRIWHARQSLRPLLTPPGMFPPEIPFHGGHVPGAMLDPQQLFESMRGHIRALMENPAAHEQVLGQISNTVFRTPRDGAAMSRGVSRRINRSSAATTTWMDGGERLTLRRDGDSRRLRAVNRNGEVVFDGAIDTEADRAQVPEAYQERLEWLERLSGPPIDEPSDTVY